MLLISAHRLVMLYISTKFHEIILNGIKVIERTITKGNNSTKNVGIKVIERKITKGNNSTKNVGGVTIV